jgi:predicted metal-binding membrane protein
MASSLAAIEAVARRDRLIVLASLAAVAALCWWYLIDMAMAMGEMGAMGSMRAQPWDLGYFVAMFVMWTVMMVGMMVPSAAPMILLYARIQRKQADKAPYISTWLFTAGYLFTWTIFSLLAASMQWTLTELALLNPMMESGSPWFAGVLFAAAGIYQLTPLKNACLKHCQSPLQFISHHWRKGRFGPLRMGIEHGAYCTGCCWVLMALLFTLGVMNLLWVAALTVFVLLEKVVRLGDGRLVPRVGSLAMVATGALFLARGAGLT